MPETNPAPAWLARATARPAIAIVLLWLAIWSWSYGRWDLAGADEGRYVAVALELLRCDSWWLLRVEGEPYDQKPPLPFWLFATALSLNDGEISSWLVRLPSMFAALATLLLVARMGERLFSRRCGLLSAAILATSPGFVAHAPTVRLDMMLTAWVALSIYPWITRDRGAPLPWGRALWMWGALYGGMMTKGPPAALFVLAPVVAEAARRRSWRTIRDCRPLLGAAMVVGGVAFWLGMEAREAGWQFVRDQVFGETVGRVSKGAHRAPFWFFPPKLFGSLFLPWSIALLPAAYLLWRERRSLSPSLAGLIGWILIPLLALSLSSGKRSSYALPLMPALAILVGRWIDEEFLARPAPRRLALFVGGLWCLAGLALLGLLVAHLGFRELLVERDLGGGGAFEQAAMAILGAALAALGVRVTRSGGDSLRIASASLLAMVAVAAFLASVPPALRDPSESTRPLAREIESTLSDRGLRTVGAVDRARAAQLHVYGSYACQNYESAHELEKAKSLPDLLVVDRRDLNEFEDAAIELGYSRVSTVDAADDEFILLALDRPRSASQVVVGSDDPSE